MDVVPADLSTSAVSANFTWRFTALQRQFVEGLPARWSALEAAVQDSEVQRATLHRLAGAAGSFGYIALSDAARAAECCSKADMNMALSKLHLLLLNTICIN